MVVQLLQGPGVTSRTSLFTEGHCMLGTMLGALFLAFYFILMAIPKGGEQHPNFTYEETKVQKV